MEILNSGGKSRVKTELGNCDHCGKEFYHFNWDRQRFCSKRCSYLRVKIKVVCESCGGVVYKSKSCKDRNNFNYCSRKCYDERKSQELKKIKRHTKYFKSFIEKGCECGVKDYFLLQIHHKDGNNNNNNDDNLEVVCGNCHIKRHLKFNTNGELVYHPKTLTSEYIFNIINKINHGNKIKTLDSGRDK